MGQNGSQELGKSHRAPTIAALRRFEISRG